VVVIPARFKVLAATGVLIGGLGAAALGGAFAAPSTDFAAADAAAPTATATATATPTTGAATAPRAQGKGFARHFGNGKGFLAPVAGFLGISTTDLQTALQNGQTLAQIGQAHGKSASDLTTFLKNQLKTQLDKAVANGKITSQQETTVLNNADSRFGKLINVSFKQNGPKPGMAWRGAGFGRAYLPTVAKTLGMNVSDVQTELKSGKTLAQIATEHGKTSTDLETAIINGLKPQLDKLMTTNFQQLQAQRQANHHGRPAGNGTPTPAASTTGS